MLWGGRRSSGMQTRIRAHTVERQHAEEVWKRKLDFYGEVGCCLHCREPKEELVRGLRRNVYYNGKFYDCLCFDCKCVPCEWYDPESKQCLRKNHDDY